MLSSDTSEWGCNINDSLFHIMSISKCKPQPLLEVLQLLTEKANHYTDFCLLLALGNKEKKPLTMIKKNPHKPKHT